MSILVDLNIFLLKYLFYYTHYPYLSLIVNKYINCLTPFHINFSDSERDLLEIHRTILNKIEEENFKQLINKDIIQLLGKLMD